jgi:L-fuculose-phosphate aldolase
VRRGYRILPIGVVRSERKKLKEAPKQGSLSGTEATIVIDPVYASALSGLKRRAGASGGKGQRGTSRPGCGKIIVLCWMHKADRARQKVHPRDDEARPKRGVFATRSPHRPNPISLHTVALLSVRGNVLRVRGMDAIDGTPVLDIKPHAPELDG